MADGFNDARALRITELMADFRALQHGIAGLRVSCAPGTAEYYLPGYALLRQCGAQAQTLLNMSFVGLSGGGSWGDGGMEWEWEGQAGLGMEGEREREGLRGVLLDASIRRFRCQRIYLQATAAMRWINSRNQVLGSAGCQVQQQNSQVALLQQLQRVDQALNSELAALTDEFIDCALRAQDLGQGRWIAEDPSLAQMQMLMAQYLPF